MICVQHNTKVLVESAHSRGMYGWGINRLLRKKSGHALMILDKNTNGGSLSSYSLCRGEQ